MSNTYKHSYTQNGGKNLGLLKETAAYKWKRRAGDEKMMPASVFLQFWLFVDVFILNNKQRKTEMAHIFI